MRAGAEVGLGLLTDRRPGEYAALARTAEAAGFDVVSVFSDLLYQPPIGALLEVAAATTRVRLGAACWNPATLHPYEIAGQVALLDAASGGRAYFGLARGTWLDQIGVVQPRPLAALREAVAVVRALLSGSGEAVAGSVFSLRPGTRLRYELPERLPPLLIGAWGPRGLALAGEVADEVKIGGSANADVVPVVRERLAPGLAAAGRPAGDVGVVLGAVTVVDEDGEAARAHARTQVAPYLAVVADLDPTVVLDPGLLAGVRARVDAGDHAGAGALVTDDVLDRFAFAGTPEQVAAHAQEVLDAGASRVEFGTPQGLTVQGGVELLGRRVLPLLRRARAVPGAGGSGRSGGP